MHELAICQALIEQVTNVANTHQATKVACINLAIGTLAGVEPLLLEHAFTIAQAGSIAASATLIITALPIQISCQQCGQTTIAQPAKLICGHCGDWRTRLISGDEMLLSQVELIF